MLAQDPQGFDLCIALIYVDVWKPLMNRARSRGFSVADIELGSPEETSAQEYLDAGTRFLAQQGIPHCPATVAASERGPARLILRISV
jgi:hypothetical protein